MALVDHATGAPFALLNFDDTGGELAATHDLLQRSDIRGRVITLDALHTTRRTAKLITDHCGADHVFSVQGNASETFGILDGIDWQGDATGHFAEDLDKAHGRLEQRLIRVLPPREGLINYPGVRQIARILRYREPLKNGRDETAKEERDQTETACVIPSLDAGTASPEELLRLNRQHWAVENLNHRLRDCVFGEDACLTRTGNGPANRASRNNLALAVIFATTPHHQDNESAGTQNGPGTTAFRGPVGSKHGRKAPIRSPINGPLRHQSWRGKVLTADVKSCRTPTAKRTSALLHGLPAGHCEP